MALTKVSRGLLSTSISDNGTGTAITIASDGSVTFSGSLTTSDDITVDQIITTNNANGTNVRIGDDAWIGDCNSANQLRIQGTADATKGYISFGSTSNTALGRSGNGDLTWGGGKVWHEGNDGNGSGLDADKLQGHLPSYFTNYTDTAIANLVDSSPSTLDTLNELASALGDDANFSTTVTNSIGTKWTQDNAKISTWDTAYSWGDHASAGYVTDITTQTDPKYLRSNASDSMTGNLTVTGTIKATHTDSAHATLTGYGIIFNRANNYFRPDTDGTKSLYIGDSGSSHDWNKIYVKTVNGTDATGALRLRGGGWASGIDSGSNVGIALSQGNYIYSDNGSYLRNIIGHESGGDITIGQSGTALITGINLTAGSSGHIVANSKVLVGTTDDTLFDNTSGSGVNLSNGVGSASTFCRESTGACIILNKTGTTNFGTIQQFRKNGTAVGSISVSSSTTAYNTSSDYRLKENVVPLRGATERLKQLNPTRFNFISDADTTVDGFLAHEVSDIVPEAISGTKDAVDGDGNPEYQGIDQSKLVPLLVATIQELEARITSLESS